MQRLPAAILGALVSASLLAGCFTGKRPSASDDPFPPGSKTGDPAIDRVLTELDRINTGPYTAEYSVLTRYGNTTRMATVSVDGARRAVTIGDVRFLTVNDGSHTCLLNTTQPCSTSIDANRVSDTQITPNFYAADAAKRLRRDATSMVAKPVSHIEKIAGQTATCVDVSLPGGTAMFCTLNGGPLARLDDASVSIQLFNYTTSVEDNAFATTR
jgi:hypothetical protein